MNQGLIPHRYAKALLLFCQEKQREQKVYDLMLRLENAFSGNPQLQQTLANPYVAAADKSALIFTAAGTDSSASPEFADFLKLLEENNRLDLLREIALAYIALYRKANRIYRVTITSAAPLAQSVTDRIHNLVKSHIPEGATADFTDVVDPELIGGFTVAIDNERLDASVASELKQLRLKLISN